MISCRPLPQHQINRSSKICNCLFLVFILSLQARCVFCEDEAASWPSLAKIRRSVTTTSSSAVDFGVGSSLPTHSNDTRNGSMAVFSKNATDSGRKTGTLDMIKKVILDFVSSKSINDGSNNRLEASDRDGSGKNVSIKTKPSSGRKFKSKKGQRRPGKNIKLPTSVKSVTNERPVDSDVIGGSSIVKSSKNDSISHAVSSLKSESGDRTLAEDATNDKTNGESASGKVKKPLDDDIASNDLSANSSASIQKSVTSQKSSGKHADSVEDEASSGESAGKSAEEGKLLQARSHGRMHASNKSANKSKFTVDRNSTSPSAERALNTTAAAKSIDKSTDEEVDGKLPEAPSNNQLVGGKPQQVKQTAAELSDNKTSTSVDKPTDGKSEIGIASRKPIPANDTTVIKTSRRDYADEKPSSARSGDESGNSTVTFDRASTLVTIKPGDGNATREDAAMRLPTKMPKKKRRPTSSTTVASLSASNSSEIAKKSLTVGNFSTATTTSAAGIGSESSNRNAADSHADSRADSKSNFHDDPRGDSHDEPKGDPRGDSKSDTRDESKGDSRGDSKSDNRDESKGDSRGDSKSDARDEPKGDSRSDSKSDARDEPKGDSHDDSKSDSRDEPKGESHTDTKLGAESGSDEKSDSTNRKNDSKLFKGQEKATASTATSTTATTVAATSATTKVIRAPPRPQPQPVDLPKQRHDPAEERADPPQDADDGDGIGGGPPRAPTKRRPSSAAVSNRGSDDVSGGGSGYMFVYFVMFVLIAGLLYVVCHRKQKIIACFVEGRRPSARRSASGSGGRQLSGSYGASGYKQLPKEDELPKVPQEKPESVQNFVF